MAKVTFTVHPLGTRRGSTMYSLLYRGERVIRDYSGFRPGEASTRVRYTGMVYPGEVTFWFRIDGIDPIEKMARGKRKDFEVEVETVEKPDDLIVAFTSHYHAAPRRSAAGT
jgi:hypothetical protein